MARAKQKWVFGFVVIAALVVVAVITNSGKEPAAPTAGHEPTPPGCRSSADCPAGHECVAPGRCSRSCKSDSDCTAGRKCGELRAMQPGPDGVPVTVMTCVRATPN
jgi:hypothetical protein